MSTTRTAWATTITAVLSCCIRDEPTTLQNFTTTAAVVVDAVDVQFHVIAVVVGYAPAVETANFNTTGVVVDAVAVGFHVIAVVVGCAPATVDFAWSIAIVGIIAITSGTASNG